MAAEPGTGATAFWRVRFDAGVRPGDLVTIALAYEQRLRVYSEGVTLGGLSILPPEAPAPYRVTPLDWAITRSTGIAWRHEIDRASVSVRVPGADVTIGRQAVGWGRGVLFGAVDLFAPFSPLEADREWRRGVDAVRADVRMTDRTSIDTVAAFGPTIDDSALVTRLRGYSGAADVEVVGGWRAGDVVGGVTSSAAVGDAEVHGEVAVFHAPASAPIGWPGRSTAVKALVGGSYRLPLGNGLLTYAEYHYSGFGVADTRDIVPALTNPAFLRRYLRGDTQILGRHAIAAIATYEASPELAFGLQWIQSPGDGSGIFMPSGTLTFSDTLSLVGIVYLSYGRPPLDSVPRSEYGATPTSGFLQIRVYL